LRALLREPLVHFLLLGCLLFLLFQWRGGTAGGGGNRIVVSAGQVASLAAGFERTWMRPPTAAELKGLIDDYVREELAVREATAQGLDQGDVVIRRRLRQKLEFLEAEETGATAPTDSALRAWLTQHPDQFKQEPAVAFRQVFVSVDRRGPAAPTAAEQILTRLRAGADRHAVGDATMLPAEVGLERLSDVTRGFGTQFSEQVWKLEPGHWSGPVESGFGLHLVYLTEKQPERLLSLDQVRPEVTRDLLHARRQAELDSMYRRLLGRYRVVVEDSARSGKP
jgi:hypothetical protein